MSVSNEENEVIRLISEMILKTNRAKAMEESFPCKSADESDTYIKSAAEKIRRLREIRESLEFTFTHMD